MPGVKGLAAMFEQRGDASPPDLTRGRSPNALSGTPPLSDSPRPLSKIRTQFVAVEKDGRIGLTRGISTDSIGSSRRASNETGTTTPQPRSEPTSDPFIETPAALSKVTSNPISTPKSRSQSPQKPPAPFGRMSPLKNTGTSTPEVMPNANPDKITDEEETKTRLQPGLPTDKLAVRGNHNAGSNGIGDSLKSALTPAPVAEVKAPKSIATPAPTAEVKTPKSIATPATEDKGPKGVSAPATEDKAPKSINAPAKATLAPVTTAKTTSKAPKSPMVSKAPKSPQPPKAPKSPTKETLKAPALAPTKKTSTADLKESHKKSVATAPAPVTASSTSTAKKPASLVVPSSGTGFVKPKVKSPTRPVKLPAGLTSHTASSSSRGNVGVAAPAPAQPAKRSRSVAPSATSQRPASRISTAGTGDGARTLRRQSSSINGSTRQSIGSIGPPPKQVAQDAPKKDYHVDEGFLARMMRPTQSSASKTTEKAPVTPPRRQAAPKSAPRHAIGADATASAKKAAAKLQAAGSTKSKDAASERTKGLGSPLGSAVSSAPKPDAAPETKSGSPKRSERAPTIEAPASGLEEQMASLTVKDEAKPIESEDNNDAQPAERISTETPEVAEGSNEPEVTKGDSTTSEVAVPELSEKAMPVVTDEPLKVEDIEDVVHEVPDMPEAATSEKESTIEAALVAASSDDTNKVGGEVKEEDEDMATPAAP